MRTPRLLTKRGYKVQVSDGQTRGVYRDRSTAEMIASLATVMEFMYLNPPTVSSVRIKRWQRFGVKAK